MSKRLWDVLKFLPQESIVKLIDEQEEYPVHELMSISEKSDERGYDLETPSIDEKARDEAWIITKNYDNFAYAICKKVSVSESKQTSA